MDAAAVVYRALSVPALVKNKADAAADRVVELSERDPERHRPSRLLNIAGAICEATIAYINEGGLDPVLGDFGMQDRERHAMEIRERARKLLPQLGDDIGDELALVVIGTLKDYVMKHPDDDGSGLAR